MNKLIELKNAIKSKVLFRTEDGIDIFEGDEFYMHVIPFNDKNKINICRQIATDYYKTYKFKKKELLFSSPEKAKEYIKINKPILSKKDIIDVYQRVYNIFSFRTELEKLIDKKLNL